MNEFSYKLSVSRFQFGKTRKPLQWYGYKENRCRARVMLQNRIFYVKKNTVTRFLSYYLSFSSSTSQPMLKVNREHESTKNGDWQHYAATLHDSPTIFSIREYHSPMRVCSTMSLPDCRFRIGLRTPNTARSARLGFEPPITIRFHINQNFMLIVNF